MSDVPSASLLRVSHLCAPLRGPPKFLMFLWPLLFACLPMCLLLSFFFPLHSNPPASAASPSNPDGIIGLSFHSWLDFALFCKTFSLLGPVPCRGLSRLPRPTGP